jgi:cephalosporin hydroxylase
VITIDTEAGLLTILNNGQQTIYRLGTAEAFAAISQLWLRAGWDAKYVYSFTWMGRPIIQLPEDLVRVQELVYRVKPDVIVETGIAHGGSLVFYASLCKAMGRGRVFGIDVEIRPHNRRAIEAHELFPLITLIEGSSIDPEVVGRVKTAIHPGEQVLILLDSCHTRDHVLGELNAYAPLVSIGSYIVVMDGIMSQLAKAPRGQLDWTWNNPTAAAAEFVKNNPNYVLEEPAFLFNEGAVTERVTYWPNGFIRRIA